MNDKPIPAPPEGFRTVHRGETLPPFYAAEMLRPLLGRTVWFADVGGRTRCGELESVPNVREDETGAPPVGFADERTGYLRNIVAIAVYEPR